MAIIFKLFIIFIFIGDLVILMKFLRLFAAADVLKQHS